jgi:hypothetical protein
MEGEGGKEKEDWEENRFSQYFQERAKETLQKTSQIFNWF